MALEMDPIEEARLRGATAKRYLREQCLSKKKIMALENRRLASPYCKKSVSFFGLRIGLS